MVEIGGGRTVRNFGRVRDAVEVPDLVAIQRTGYSYFLQEDVAPTRRKYVGLEALFREIFPIESYDEGMRLEYLYYELEKPRYSPIECRQLRLTYGYPLKISCRLRTRDGKDLAEQSIYLGEMPVMIGGGEFIINGAERVIVNQLHRSPGVDFLIDSKEGDRILHGGRTIPERGSWIEISVTRKDVLVIRIDQSSRIPATIFLRAMDPAFGSTEAILRQFYPTQTVTKAKLTPAMWAVGPIVDAETGEVIVKAGTQIGDRLSVVRQSGPKEVEVPNGKAREWEEVPKKEACEWEKENLEYNYLVTEKGTGGPLAEDELKCLEHRLIQVYPDEERRQQFPRFNNNIGSKGKSTDDVEANFAKCRARIEADKGWREVDDWDGVPDTQGVYFYRNKKTKKVNHGYVGRADVTPTWKGIIARIKHHHKGTVVSGDNLLKAIAEEIVAGEVQKRKRGPVVFEVIEEVRDALILNTLAEDDCQNHEQALLKFYVRLRPGNPPSEEKAKTFFTEKFFDANRYRLGKVGRFRLNRKFGQSIDENEMTLRPEDFINTMKYIVALRNNEGELDDIDHLGNRRLRTIDELASDEIRKGLLKLRKTVQERMSVRRDEGEEPLRIADLINSKSVSSSINYFFGRGELSQVVDQTNALSQLTHERRLSALGPGGLNRRRAGFEVRDVHISHYGRVCPVETPEGTNIGLISSLAIFCTIDEYGFLLTPYRKVNNGVVTDEVAYLRADEDMKAVIAAPGTVDQRTGKIEKGMVLAMKGGELAQVPSDEVNYVDVSTKQIVGISASLIPFLEHDDANRALMGSNMQRQAVPLLKTEQPLVCTGMEEVVGRNSSMVVRAERGGVVTEVDATKIVINQTDEYEFAKFVGLNERTCLNQKPLVKIGDRVDKGQVIADGGGTAEGALALGKNVLVGFVSFDGFNFEDAIIVSEKLVRNDSFTSIHIDEFTAEVRETRLGREEFTNDIPNVSEKALRNLDEHGVVREGTRVCAGDILVGKVVPKSKTELTPEEKLLHAIFGRAGEDVKNDSLELPSGYEGVVIKTKRFTRRGVGGEQAKKALAAQIKQYENQMRAKQCAIFRLMIEAIHKKFEVTIIDSSTRQKVGTSLDDEVIYEQVENFDIKWVKPASVREEVQKIVEKFWGDIAEIQEDTKRKVETMKHGDELPSGVLEMVEVYVATKRTLAIGDKIAGRHGNKGVIAKIMPEEDMPFLEDGTPLDILLNPLGVPSRMNVGQILETHLGWVAKVLGFQAISPVFDGATEDDIQKATAEANELMTRRKAEYDGRTSEQASQKVARLSNLSLDCDTRKGRKNRQEFLDLYFRRYLTRFKFVDIENLIGRRLGAEEDKAANDVDGVESALELLEKALFLTFPDPQPPPHKDKELGAKCRHLPRFNMELTKKKGDLAERDPDAFRKQVLYQVSRNELLNRVFNECIRAINSPDGWLPCHNESAQKDAKKVVPEKQGLYFFCNQEGVSSADGVAKGYIGLAGDEPKGNLRYRICDQHFNASRNDNFPGTFKKHEEWRLSDEQQPPPFQEKWQAPPADEFFINVPKTLKARLYDGRTGEPFDQGATIGYIYMMKLHHLVDDKIHARATGPYSLITQQPLGGKARTGGQRFGEMEVWALEGYGAAYTLQEMLTVKSDDVEGRTKIYESMVKGTNKLEAGTPLSFDVLCNEIRGLGLNIQLEKRRLGGSVL